MASLGDGLLLTNHAGKVVEGKALVARDGQALVVVLPRSEQEELAAGAGIHALTSGLGQVGKAVLLKDDQRQALVEGGAHDSFLAW